MAETTDRVAGYELAGALGRGASGEIHLARPPGRLGIPADAVVLKVLAGRHPQERFLQVAERLRIFTSADPTYLTTLFETGREQGTIWISMPHYRLGSLVEPALPLSHPELLQAVANAARGAHALHEAGVAHGDIKPTNVLLTDTGAKLADIDLRTCLHPNMTLAATSMLADVEFAEPSVIRGEPPTRTTDIWSLGVTLYRLLTGETLYSQTPDDDMMSIIRRITSTRPDIGETPNTDEGQVVRACLAPDPAERPPTAEALAKIIEDLL